jgi:hypothetical protein
MSAAFDNLELRTEARIDPESTFSRSLAYEAEEQKAELPDLIALKPEFVK